MEPGWLSTVNYFGPICGSITKNHWHIFGSCQKQVVAIKDPLCVGVCDRSYRTHQWRTHVANAIFGWPKIRPHMPIWVALFEGRGEEWDSWVYVAWRLRAEYTLSPLECIQAVKQKNYLCRRQSPFATTYATSAGMMRMRMWIWMWMWLWLVLGIQSLRATSRAAASALGFSGGNVPRLLCLWPGNSSNNPTITYTRSWHSHGC